LRRASWNGRPGSRRRRSQQGGFTLVELLVTLTVTVIGLAGMLSLFNANSRNSAISSRTAHAATAAQETIEELRGIPVATLTTLYGALPIEDADLDPIDGPAGLVLNRRMSFSSLPVASGDLFLLRVEVYWTDDGATPGSDDGRYDHTVALELVRTRQEAL
jgi:prepilin-type N-terminal cleavage/methylation domain-containing protein